MIKKDVSLFFLSLGTTLSAAMFLAALYIINVRTAAVIGCMPELPELPDILLSARWLDALRSTLRMIFPLSQGVYELMYYFFRALFHAV